MLSRFLQFKQQPYYTVELNFGSSVSLNILEMVHELNKKI